MHIVVTFLITASLLMSVVFTVGQDLVTTYDTVAGSWTVLLARSQQRADTKVAGPIGLSVSATSTVQITLVNEGEVALGKFGDWDVLFEVQKSPGLGVHYLTHTENASPGADQWAVKRIYLDASTLEAEIVDPGVFNPGEEMVVVANPSNQVKANTTDRATFVTPNGVVAKVIFEVVP